MGGTLMATWASCGAWVASMTRHASCSSNLHAYTWLLVQDPPLTVQLPAKPPHACTVCFPRLHGMLTRSLEYMCVPSSGLHRGDALSAACAQCQSSAHEA